MKVKEKVKLLYRSLFSPNKRTLLNAIKDNMLADWPTLTENQVQDHISEGDIHFKRGHMYQFPKNTKSNKNKQSNTQENELTPFSETGPRKPRNSSTNIWRCQTFERW